MTHPEHAEVPRLTRREWDGVLAALRWADAGATEEPSAARARWMRQNTHAHEYSEIVVSLSGAHDYGIGGEVVPLSPGQAALIPVGVPHDAWYGRHHAACEDFWLHLLPHGTATLNFISHRPGRDLVFEPVPGIVPQFQEEFRRAVSLLGSFSAGNRGKAAQFLMYLLHELFECLRETDFDSRVDGGSSVIADVKLYAVKHLTDSLTLNDLAKAAGYSPFHFHRMFLESEGITPRAFVEAQRLKKACGLLKSGLSITSAAMDSGFSSSAQFAQVFKKKFALSPSEWLKTAARPRRS